MNRGFTLLEMVVTIGIAAMISGLVLADFPKFSRRLELSRTAQAVALSFREAEAAALGVRQFGGIFPAYGLHFDTGAPGEKQYILFADLNSNFLYDAADVNSDGRPDELVDLFLISGAPRIADRCAGRQSGSLGAGCGSLDVLFIRPNPDVSIRLNGTPLTFSDAEIVIQISTGECKRVVIWSTGQLSLEPTATSC